MSETLTPPEDSAAAIIARADELRQRLPARFRDQMVETLYQDADRIAGRAAKRSGSDDGDFDQRVDRFVTSPIFGLPLMLLMISGVFWLTIVGANYPSQWLAEGLFWLGDRGSALFLSYGVPAFLTGFIWQGVYKGLAWVVSVMLPPMAIFFPLFTILEDLGYLPRVAFNWTGSSGKPARMASRPSRWPWGSAAMRLG